MAIFLNKPKNSKYIAAIDLGSNALRAVIAKEENKKITIVKNLRTPLRLGEDVFATGKISLAKLKKAEEAYIMLLHFFADFNVTKILATATSAMREASNSQILKKRVFEATGIDIEIISGLREANFVCEAVKTQINLKNKTAIIMDIGGGSTEFIIIKNNKIVDARSFDIGTVRLIKYQDPEELEKKIDEELEKAFRFISYNMDKKKPDIFIGTGGNLRRIGKIRKKFLNKPSAQVASYGEIKRMSEAISRMSYVDRVKYLELNENRADVILPATLITQKILERYKLNKVLLPKVGLKEGLLLSLKDFPKEIDLVLKD